MKKANDQLIYIMWELNTNYGVLMDIMAMDKIDAFIFDVFGTVVDWESAVVADLESLGAPQGIRIVHCVSDLKSTESIKYRV